MRELLSFEVRRCSLQRRPSPWRIRAMQRRKLLVRLGEGCQALQKLANFDNFWPF